MNLIRKFLPFKKQQQQEAPFLKPTNNNQIIIAGYEFKREFIQTNKLTGKFVKALNAHDNYLRIQKQENSETYLVGLKQGQKQSQNVNENLIKDMVKFMISSSMKGFVFIRLKPSILLELSKVNFNSLHRLQIVNCGISNLQALQWLQTSHFDTIYLKNNEIVSLKPLQKTKWDSFYSIQLDGNPLKSFSPLCRTKTRNNPNILKNQFLIYLTQEAVQTGDISFLVKMQSKLTRFMSQQISTQVRIKQSQVNQAIVRLHIIPPPKPVNMVRQQPEINQI